MVGTKKDTHKSKEYTAEPAPGTYELQNQNTGISAASPHQYIWFRPLTSSYRVKISTDILLTKTEDSHR